MSDTVKLRLFGNPVDYSQSPAIHRLFGENLGLDVEYRAVETNADELAEKLSMFRSIGGIGANLTVPLKQAGMQQCIRVDRGARQARAVNTLLASDEGWQGFNTDGPGLILDLERLGIDISDARILIIGAGGAVAGLLGPLLACRPRRICVLNRTLDRAEQLADKFGHLGPVRAAALSDGPGDQGYDLLIQSTSAGHEGGLVPIERSWLSAAACGYDLNYGPAHAPFAQWCRNHDLPGHDGLGMLVAQAALAFEIWTGKRPALGRVLAQLRQGLPAT